MRFLLFNTLSRFVIAFLPRSKSLLILWLQSLSSLILESRKIKLVTFSIFSSSICHEIMGSDARILAFWKLNFSSVCLIEPAFSLSSFTFINRLFSSSSLSAIKVISSAYLKLLIFLLTVLVPACESSSPTFHMMYSEYKLNKQSDNIQPQHTPFPIWNHSIVPCLVLTVASCPSHRFHRRQTRWSGIPICSQIFQFVCDPHSQRFSKVNEAEVDVFLEFHCFFYDPADVGNVISGLSAFSKCSLYIWEFSVPIA